MKKIHTITTVILAVIILVGGVITLNLFVLGKVKNVSSIGVKDLSVTNEKVFFSPVFMTSADIMSKYSYRMDNDIMYIKIKSVLVGGVGKKNIEIIGDFSALQKIVLEDTENEKIIWER